MVAVLESPLVGLLVDGAELDLGGRAWEVAHLKFKGLESILGSVLSFPLCWGLGGLCLVLLRVYFRSPHTGTRINNGHAQNVRWLARGDWAKCPWRCVHCVL